MPPAIGQVVLVVYALLLAAGGYAGYATAGSKASLRAGLGLGALALAGALVSRFGPTRVGFIIGLIGAAMAAAAMGARLASTKKFMPAGMVLILSLVVIGVLIASLARLRVPS